MSFACILTCKLFLQTVAIFSTDATDPAPPSQAHIDDLSDLEYEPPKHFVCAPLLTARSEWHILGLGLSIAVPVLEHIHPRIFQQPNIHNPFSCIPITYLPLSFPLYMHLCAWTSDPDLQSRILHDTELVLDAIPDLWPTLVRNWIPSKRHRRAEGSGA
jgi:hypothetical protein